MHKSKNIVHINTKAKRSQTSCFQEVWPFYSLTSVKDGNTTIYVRDSQLRDYFMKENAEQLEKYHTTISEVYNW